MGSATIDSTRRRFLRGGLRQGPPTVRPPWTDDDRLAAACTRCNACVTACPEGVLRAGDGGFPQLDPSAGGCSFCGACATACAEPVFDRALTPALPVRVAVAEADCLAHAGIHCEICRDACPESAIGFVRTTGRIAVPAVVAEACTGCGACIGPCPASALSLTAVRAGGRTA
ncbi:ferredoxin-type protein NapF [Thalassobaculum sp.]|uniref:ferredoxin-type protein NapF n=1 Tax=Thalassobaculum sp. TaxID=2022740 RepID=UPI0032EBAED5